MKILFIGGFFHLSHQVEIMKNTKTTVEYAGNALQMKLISGFEKNDTCDLSLLSAPEIGAYPGAYKDWYFRGFQNKSNGDKYQYVSFLNIWGIRNLSRAHSLKVAVKNFVNNMSNEKWIVVYSPHTPFLEAACYAKKKDSRIRVCLIVPDLPQYMNLAKTGRRVYDFFKKIDIKRFYELKKHVDCFVLLTEAMKDVLEVGKRPYIVVEGICDDVGLSVVSKKTESTYKNIVYAGKLNESSGVLNLIEAFKQISSNDIRLIICGNGVLRNEIIKQSIIDKRIQFKGQISMQDAKIYIKNAAVLVNPRQNNEEYTKYSFPSKNIDYLMSGNPVVSYRLDGIPNIYEKFLYYVPETSIDSLSGVIQKVLKTSKIETEAKSKAAFQYLSQMRNSDAVVKKILCMFRKS